MADWANNGDWATNGDWEGIAAGDALLKIQSETLQLSEEDLTELVTILVKVQSESLNLSEDDLKFVVDVLIVKVQNESVNISESNLKVLEIAPTGHTGWGIPIGIS